MFGGLNAYLLNVYVPESMCKCMCKTPEGQKRALNHLELELEIVVNAGY